MINGVAFKKTFSYAGFEMQQKRYENPKLSLLNIELELKAEKDNAEIRVESVEVSPEMILVPLLKSEMILVHRLSPEMILVLLFKS